MLYSTFMKLGVAGAAVIATGFGISACCACPPVEARTVVVCPADGGVAPEESFEADQSPEALALQSPCARSCRSLSKLGCPESKKLLGGRSCLDTCKAILTISSFDPECVAAAKTVVEVRKCPQVKCDAPAVQTGG